MISNLCRFKTKTTMVIAAAKSEMQSSQIYQRMQQRIRPPNPPLFHYYETWKYRPTFIYSKHVLYFRNATTLPPTNVSHSPAPAVAAHHESAPLNLFIPATECGGRF